MKRARTDVLAPAAKKSKKVAYDFVLDALSELRPTTRAMFGSTAVYLGERVLFILRKKGDLDDGVWVAFDEHRAGDATAALPNLKPIQRLPNVRSWRKLAESHPDFEEDVLEACRLAGDPDGPLGKVPVRQKAKRERTAAPGVRPAGARVRRAAPKPVRKRIVKAAKKRAKRA
jgi:hypothetical protein